MGKHNVSSPTILPVNLMSFKSSAHRGSCRLQRWHILHHLAVASSSML